eukprot:CAMPEP_0172610914 /NCGR_PEP_ID=MMETSP1068-20121228/30664_1 /TAXON_ID=35684 /ORGANISM="Pseudopedinella elastica, Strain CCMP716" /LENGTH=281 /DNA_ID=CAMNT_0013414739 /DNA_START=95 /DNA_END=936 /DNA_ORIENTATION=-
MSRNPVKGLPIRGSSTRAESPRLADKRVGSPKAGSVAGTGWRGSSPGVGDEAQESGLGSRLSLPRRPGSAKARSSPAGSRTPSPSMGGFSFVGGVGPRRASPSFKDPYKDYKDGAAAKPLPRSLRPPGARSPMAGVMTPTEGAFKANRKSDPSFSGVHAGAAAQPDGSVASSAVTAFGLDDPELAFSVYASHFQEEGMEEGCPQGATSGDPSTGRPSQRTGRGLTERARNDEKNEKNASSAGPAERHSQGGRESGGRASRGDSPAQLLSSGVHASGLVPPP